MAFAPLYPAANLKALVPSKLDCLFARFFAWLCLAIYGCTFGVGARADSPFTVKSWSVENGLPRSSVISIIQSRNGYLWLATINGLVRFDGNQFTVFNQFNTPGLTSDQIVYLFEDSQTNLWIGTESSGVLQLKNGQFKDFVPSGNVGKLVYADEDSATNVWFCTMDGDFFCYRNGQMNFHPSDYPTQLFYRIFHLRVPGKNGFVWQLQSGRVEKFQDDKLKENFGASPWQNSQVVASYKTPDGSSIQIPFDANVTAVCEDRSGNLIVGTRNDGVYWFNASGGCSHISKEQGLSSSFVLSMCLDAEGDLWVGTDGGGLDRIKRKIFSTPEATHPWSLESMAQDTNGGLWMTFNGHGLSYCISNSIQDFGIGLGSNAWSVLVDDQQQVWAGTRTEGLFTFGSDKTFHPVAGADALGSQINALFQSRDGIIWAGTENGLARWDGQNWKMFTTADGLSENSVRAIAEDAQGNLWVGTENSGVNCFKDGKFTAVRAGKNSLPGDDISCLFADGAGDLWVGTLGHGLARLHDGKWSQFSTTNGLAGNSIAFVIDDEDAMWIGSNVGLMRIAKKSFDDLAAGKINSLSCRIYSSADGLPTSECSFGAQPSAIRTRNGDLWFPTAQGPAFVNPKNIRRNLEPPRVVIESVRVDGVEQKTNQLSSSWDQSITLSPKNEQLEIRYTSLNLAAPERTLFKYWLENYERTWTDAGSDRVARFPKLPPGKYRFHVEACNEDGVWNETGSILDVNVRPPFWRTWWFVTISIIGLVALIVGVVHFISTQKLRRKIRQQESLEKERSRIARDLHDQLGANLTQVTLLGEMTEADKNLPDEVELNAKQICLTARETTRSLDEIVWAVNPANDTLEGLANYACKYAQDYFALAGLRYRAEVPAQLPPVELLPEVRHNVFLAFKEAVNNVVKHAQASEAHVRLQLQENNFTLNVEDNGRGLGNLEAAKLRNGLKNMRQRLNDVGGEFSISAGTNGGTIVSLTVPIGQKIV